MNRRHFSQMDLDEMDSDLVAAGRRLLQHANGSWRTASGRLYNWHNEDVLNEGRSRFHNRSRRAGEEDASDEGLGHYGGEYDFWAATSPWRLRVEPVREVWPEQQADGEVKEVSPDAVIINDRRWWVVRGREVTSGGMPPDRRVVVPDGTRLAVYGETVVPDPEDYHVTPGMYNVDVLLKPASLVQAFDFVAADRATVYGRAGIRLEARPRPGNEFYIAARSLAALGVDEYVVTVDEELGIALEVDAYLRGRLARRHALSGLLVERPADAALFLP